MDSTETETQLIYAEQPGRVLAALRRAATHIDFYRHYLSPIDLASDAAEALAQFPILGKKDLVTLGPALFDQAIDDAFLISETSGTTGGEILPTPRSADEMNWNTQNLAQMLSVHVRPGLDRVALLHPVVMSPFADAFCLAATRQRIPYLRVFSVPTVCDYPRILRILSRYRVTTVLTTPTLAAKLCFERDRLSYADWPVRRFLLTGELLTPEWKRCLVGIGAGTEMRAFVYGASESASCMYGCAHDLYHPVSDFAFELMGPSPRVRNEGNLLVTWLNPGIRPLVRYRTDDLFEVVGNCPCGKGIALRARGRVGADHDAVSIQALEAILAESPSPIYHYEFRARLNTISLFTLPRSTMDASLLARIRTAHPSLNGTSVDINPADHPFLSAVVPPKMSRVIQTA